MQVEVVNDSGRKLPKVPPNLRYLPSIARVRSNGKFSTRRLTQAEVVNYNGRKLPKVPQTNGESVHLSVYEHED